MTASLAVDALNMAAWARRGVDIDGVVCHSDAGSQGEIRADAMSYFAKAFSESSNFTTRVSAPVRGSGWAVYAEFLRVLEAGARAVGASLDLGSLGTSIARVAAGSCP